MHNTLRSALFFLAVLGLSVAAFVVHLLYRWTRAPVLRSFLLFLLSLAGIVVSAAVPGSYAPFGIPAALTVEVAAELLYLAVLPRFVFDAVGTRLPRWSKRAYAVLYLLVAGYYCASVFGGSGASPAVAVFSFSLTITLAIYLGRRLHRLGDRYLLRIFRRFLQITAVFLPLMILDSAGSSIGWKWADEYDRIAAVLYLLAISALIIRESSAWLIHVADGKSRRDAPPDSPAATSEAADLGAFDLSPRQAEIARLILRGYSAKEIAAELHISPKTAENHTYSLYRKLGARSRIQFYDRVRRANVS